MHRVRTNYIFPTTHIILNHSTLSLRRPFSPQLSIKLESILQTLACDKCLFGLLEQSTICYSCVLVVAILRGLPNFGSFKTKMNIIVKKSTMVRPAKETPKKILWLSRLDMIYNPYTHSHGLFIYKSPETKTTSPTDATLTIDADNLLQSLSKALVAFYPMAGRLTINELNGRYEINCNAEGALFVEAEATCTLDDLINKPPDVVDDLRKQLIPKCDYTLGLSSFPLLMTQLTRFKCGGVCLCAAQHHHAFGGATSAYFNNSWARIARGLDIDVDPVHDRAFHLGPRNPPQIKFKHSEFQPPLPPLLSKDLSGKLHDAIDGIFKLSKDEINALKLQATLGDKPRNDKFSTFEILAGHVWRCATKARGMADDQEVSLCIPVNGATRLKNPTLPQGYCGNVLIYPTCTLKAKELMKNPLVYAARKVHEMMKEVNDPEYLRSSIDYLESQSNLEPFVRNAKTVTCPNLSINSWASIPFSEQDFGWGKPTSLLHAGVRFEGQSVFVPSTIGDGSLSLAIKLYAPHLARFGKHFYAIGNQVKYAELEMSKDSNSRSRL